MRMTTMGELVTVDFITAALLDGRGFQVRAGTIATGIAAENVLSDTVASMCVDAATATTIIPIKLHIAAREIATALTMQVALKAVGAVSSAGTAFVPLPLQQGGVAAVSTARVAADALTVTAELATTTRRLFEYENVNTQPTVTTGPVTLDRLTIAAGVIDLRYIGVGPACVYLQVAATTAFPLWFGTIDYLEFPSLLVVPS
jgi:hypothetical protein